MNANEKVSKDYTTSTSQSAGTNLSWRAVIAGVVTFIAISFMLSLVGTAIGFGAPDLTAAHPFEGVGGGLVAWTIFSLIVSLAGAGFVAGFTANRAGFIHGFLTWAASLLTIVFIMGSLATSTLRVAGNVVGGVGSTVTDITGSVTTTVSGWTKDAFNSVTKDMEIDTSELDGQVQQVLEDTDIPELQPDYLRDQVSASVDDISNAAYDIVVNGKDAEKTIKKLSDDLLARADKIASNVDRDAVVNAVAANTDLSTAEAEQAADNIEAAYQDASKQAKDLIVESEAKVKQTTKEIEKASEKGIKKADEVSDDVAKYSLWTFFGLLVAMVLTSYAGYFGAKQTDWFTK